MGEADVGGESASPSERLAVETVALLVGAGLVRDEPRLNLADRIATGTMTAGDWRLELELAAQKANQK